jgi:tetratricopeptide (TPR) repeat protein
MRKISPRLNRKKLTGPVFTIFTAALFLASGCTTLQQDQMVSSVEEERFQELEIIENELIEIRLYIFEEEGEPGAVVTEDLRRIREALNVLAASGTLNFQYNARLDALRGIETLMSGNLKRASGFLESAEKNWKGDEVVLLLSVLLMEDPEQQLGLLEELVKEGRGLYRLQAEKGGVHFTLGQYGRAIAAFDESLPFLPENYSRLYESRREQAWRLKDTDTALESKSVAQLSTMTITLKVMVEVTERETELLDYAIGGDRLNERQLYERMRQRGYVPEAAEPSAVVHRQDVALFLWKLISDKYLDPEMLTRYSKRYKNRSSPILDVEVSFRWFDAILGCVETEIMELPDGMNFFPGREVNGLDYLRWLEQAEEY